LPEVEIVLCHSKPRFIRHLFIIFIFIVDFIVVRVYLFIPNHQLRAIIRSMNERILRLWPERVRNQTRLHSTIHAGRSFLLPAGAIRLPMLFRRFDLLFSIPRPWLRQLLRNIELRQSAYALVELCALLQLLRQHPALQRECVERGECWWDMTGSGREEFVRRWGAKGLLVCDIDAGGEVDVGRFRCHVAIS